MPRLFRSDSGHDSVYLGKIGMGSMCVRWLEVVLWFCLFTNYDASQPNNAALPGTADPPAQHFPPQMLFGNLAAQSSPRLPLRGSDDERGEGVREEGRTRGDGPSSSLVAAPHLPASAGASTILAGMKMSPTLPAAPRQREGNAWSPTPSGWNHGPYPHQPSRGRPISNVQQDSFSTQWKQVARPMPPSNSLFEAGYLSTHSLHDDRC